MKVHFVVNNPKIDKRQINRGEDAPPVLKDGIIIICDGTGATGQNEHEIDGEVFTSAYLGSRMTSRIADSFLTDNYEKMMDSFDNPEELCFYGQELCGKIQKGLSDFSEQYQLKMTVRGKSFKLLPTTFTAVLYKEDETNTNVIVLSAGDSHALWWDIDGLHQLSNDDFNNGTDLSVGDCNVNNCISADSDFHINCICHKLPLKGILFATSDGFTDPIRPFEQEKYLIEWIGNFEDVSESHSDELSKNISENIDNIGFSKRDDCSIAGIITGYESSEQLKQDFRKRYPILATNYIKPYYTLNVENDECEKEKRNIDLNIQADKKRVSDQLISVIKKIFNNQDLIKTNCDLELLYKQVMNTRCIHEKIAESSKRIAERKDEYIRNLENKRCELNIKYLDFLKKLCRVGIDAKRFNSSVIRAINKINDTIVELKKCRNQYNEAIDELQQEEGIVGTDISKYDSELILDVNKKAHDLSLSAEKFNRILVDYNNQNEIISEFFNINNPTIQELFRNDFESEFAVLTQTRMLFTHKKDMNDLMADKEEMLRINDAIRQLQYFVSDQGISELLYREQKKIVLSNIDLIVEEIVCDDGLLETVLKTESDDLRNMLKQSVLLELQSNKVVSKRKMIWELYRTQYEFYLTNSKNQMVFKKEGLK